MQGCLTEDDYLWLAEQGYIKTFGNFSGIFKSIWQIVILTDKEIQTKLFTIGERLKEKYKENFNNLKKPYIEAVLRSVPTHLRKVKEYELQFIFHSDGLKEPTEGQKKTLTTLIFPE